MPPLLSVADLSLNFPTTQAVRSISFELYPGEMLAIVGESGSGKSLTALSCLGLQPANAQMSGDIILEGVEVLKSGQNGNANKLRDLRRKTAGMVFQEPMTALNPLHNIGRQISEALQIHDSKHNDQLVDLLEQVGLAHFKNRLDAYPHQLSGGERQRVMIAMAIAKNPRLLIADEPTTAVDVTVQAKILHLLKSLQITRSMAIMLITHDLTIVKKLADRVIIMKSGEIVEQGKVADIFSAPQHPYTKLLLASEPKGSALPLPEKSKEKSANDADIISCETLTVNFPIKSGFFRKTTGYITAVNDISLAISAGSTLAIVGESGSGKSTLGFALLKLLKSSGKIIWQGRDISALPSSAMRDLRKNMQLVFQDPFSSLNPRMTIGQIIGEGLAVHEPRTTNHDLRTTNYELRTTNYDLRITSIIERVGLPADMLERFPHECSGGQRQRIAIARAMILRPEFVVLDEPTSALDLTVQSQIIDLLKDFQKNDQVGYLFISHDLRVVRAIAHNIAVLYQGKVIEYGKTAEILQNPANEYTKRLIDAAML